MNDRVRVALVLSVALALTVAGLVFLRSGERRSPPPLPGPLASPAVAPGAVGGLLPDVVLRNRNGQTDARRLRPGVLVLVRGECGCLDQVRQVVAEAAPFRLVTYVVTTGSNASAAESLAARSGGAAAGFADAEGTLAGAYRLRSDAAVVLVRRDGVVSQVVAAVAPSLRLRESFRALVA